MDFKPLDPSVHSWHWFTMTDDPADDMNGGAIILLWNADAQWWQNTFNSRRTVPTRSSYIGPVARPYTNKELLYYKIKRIWDNTPGLTERATLIRLVRDSRGWCHSLHQTAILVKEALTYWSDHQDVKAYELLNEFQN